MMELIIIGILAAALLLALFSRAGRGNEVQIQRRRVEAVLDRERQLCAEVKELSRKLGEAAEVLQVHRAMQSDAKWQPQLTEVLRRYYRH